MIPKENYTAPPSYFGQFSDVIEQTISPYVKITTDTNLMSASQSTLGGLPYLPQGFLHPKDSLGKEMLLIAQINFSEADFQVPFPTSGLLQFFVSASAKEQSSTQTGFFSKAGFKVRYFANIEPYTYPQIALNQSTLPQYALHFEKSAAPISLTDYRFTYYISQHDKAQFLQQYCQPFDDLYIQNFPNADHKIGGYADFRKGRPYNQQYNTLLLQLFSDDDLPFSWGDSGSIKFFINNKDLKERNFSHVALYSETY